MNRTRIVIFAKAPVAGRVKTRLIPALGVEGAAKLAGEMLRATIQAALQSGLAVELCTDPKPSHPEWEPWLPGDAVLLTSQGAGDLGERLARAAGRAVGEDQHPLLIGTDCPELDAAILRSAAEGLGDHDAIIHPASDGGYVLLGLRRFDPSLFDGIAWSTSRVAEETIARIRRLGWSLHIGDTLRDIDEPRDIL